MKKINSVKKNFFYNGLLLFFNLGFPLITAPYISKILGIDKIGEINFGLAYVNWFIILGTFGIPAYATREIAKFRDNKEKIDTIFSQSIILIFLGAFLSFVTYSILIFFIPKFYQYRFSLFLYSLYLFFNVFSLEWFFTGLEEFSYISKRNFLIKTISLILIFNFVKTPSDIYIYILIFVFTMGIGNCVNYFYSKKYATLTFKNLNFSKFLFNSRFFYFQVLVGSIYTFLDQILLGYLSNSIELAYYSRSRQIVSILISLITISISTIGPRAINYFKNDFNNYIKIVNSCFLITCFILFPSMLTGIIFSENIMLILGGEAFKNSSFILSTLFILSFFTVFSVFFNTIISIPFGKEKNTFYANVSVAILSLILNFFLLKKMGALGAVISIISGEALGTFMQFYFIKKEKLYTDFLKNNISIFIFSTVVTGVFGYLMKNIILGSFNQFLIIIPLMISLYFFIIYIFFKVNKSEYSNLKEILSIINKNKE